MYARALIGYSVETLGGRYGPPVTKWCSWFTSFWVFFRVLAYYGSGVEMSRVGFLASGYHFFWRPKAKRHLWDLVSASRIIPWRSGIV